ncbi:MAG TPA: hypothetical protein VFZ65_15535 [Planctomycetota bacterium]|nr:hypothetical protein [Planctomycetota bacterium]
MLASQQDHASDERRVEATESEEQPRFKSNRECQSPRARRSRLMVKDVSPRHHPIGLTRSVSGVSGHPRHQRRSEIDAAASSRLLDHPRTTTLTASHGATMRAQALEQVSGIATQREQHGRRRGAASVDGLGAGCALLSPL